MFLTCIFWLLSQTVAWVLHFLLLCKLHVAHGELGGKNVAHKPKSTEHPCYRGWASRDRAKPLRTIIRAALAVTLCISLHWETTTKGYITVNTNCNVLPLHKRQGKAIVQARGQRFLNVLLGNKHKRIFCPLYHRLTLRGYRQLAWPGGTRLPLKHITLRSCDVTLPLPYQMCSVVKK